MGDMVLFSAFGFVPGRLLPYSQSLCPHNSFLPHGNLFETNLKIAGNEFTEPTCSLTVRLCYVKLDNGMSHEINNE